MLAHYHCPFGIASVSALPGYVTGGFYVWAACFPSTTGTTVFAGRRREDPWPTFEKRGKGRLGALCVIYLVLYKETNLLGEDTIEHLASQIKEVIDHGRWKGILQIEDC